METRIFFSARNGASAAQQLKLKLNVVEIGPEWMCNGDDLSCNAIFESCGVKDGEI